MKKIALIVLALAALSVMGLGFFGATEAYAGLFASASVDCDGDGIDDLTCSGGSSCTGIEGVGCHCTTVGGDLVSEEFCPEEHK